MKKHLSPVLTIVAAMAAITFPADAQVTQTTEVTEFTEVIPERPTPAPTAPGTSTTVTETVTEVAPSAPATTVTGSSTTTNYDEPIVGRDLGTYPQMHELDPVVTRRHLSVTPQTVILTPEQRKALSSTVTIESRTEPVRRVYNVQRNVVIVEEQGESRELPYVTIPVLFVVDTAELLDAESRMALEQTAAVITEIVKTEPNALFDVEGHTSTEGSAEHNLNLSAERAKRIYDELTQRYGVPPSALTAHGYGQNFAMYPQGTEPERQEDRRVLVVRTR